MQKRFSGKLTEPELNDVRRLLRSKMYWPKILAMNWYGLLLFGGVLWATVAAFLGATRPNWAALGTIWLVIAGLVAWSIFSSRRRLSNQFARLNATLPEALILETGGVTMELAAAATAFHPWQSFSGWREGERVILLDKPDKSVVIVPVALLPALERQSLRDFLRSNIAAKR